MLQVGAPEDIHTIVLIELEQEGNSSRKEDTKKLTDILTVRILQGDMAYNEELKRLRGGGLTPVQCKVRAKMAKENKNVKREELSLSLS